MTKTYTILSVVISISLFLGGLFLLALKIPFWSLLLGLPAVQIGLVLAIFSFDRLSQEEVEEELKSFKDGYKRVNL